MKPTKDGDFITGMTNISVLGTIKKRIHLELSHTKILRFQDTHTGERVLECTNCGYQDRGLGKRMISHLFTKDRYIPGSCYRTCGLLQTVDGATEKTFDMENIPVVTYH